MDREEAKYYRLFMTEEEVKEEVEKYIRENPKFDIKEVKWMSVRPSPHCTGVWSTTSEVRAEVLLRIELDYGEEEEEIDLIDERFEDIN